MVTTRVGAFLWLLSFPHGVQIYAAHSNSILYKMNIKLNLLHWISIKTKVRTRYAAATTKKKNQNIGISSIIRFYCDKMLTIKINWLWIIESIFENFRLVNWWLVAKSISPYSLLFSYKHETMAIAFINTTIQQSKVEYIYTFYTCTEVPSVKNIEIMIGRPQSEYYCVECALCL